MWSQILEHSDSSENRLLTIEFSAVRSFNRISTEFNLKRQSLARSCSPQGLYRAPPQGLGYPVTTSTREQVRFIIDLKYSLLFNLLFNPILFGASMMPLMPQAPLLIRWFAQNVRPGYGAGLWCRSPILWPIYDKVHVLSLKWQNYNQIMPKTILSPVSDQLKPWVCLLLFSKSNL